MDVILTSFGMGMDEHRQISVFHRMPPLFLEQESEHLFAVRRSRRFHIDYASLFMFERVIVDERSYEKSLNPDFSDEETDLMPPSIREAVKNGAAEYAQVLNALQRSGRLVTRPFDNTLSKANDVLEHATAMDMKNLRAWLPPLESAIREWTSVNERIRAGIEPLRDREQITWNGEIRALSLMAHVLGASSFRAYRLLEALKHWKKKQPPELRKMCRELVHDYLSYMNVNLLLSFDYQAPFIDWMDMRPLYHQKFQMAANRSECLSFGHEIAEQSRKLFDFLFPYFIPRSSSELLKAIDDARVDKLRSFVVKAINEGQNFDSLECIQILKEILKLEKKAVFRRTITGWATLPIGFIPLIGTPLQKGVEELVNHIWSDRPTNEYNWYYLISDLDVSTEA